MANVIKHKRGSGSDPVASDLVVGEVAIRTDVGKLFTKMDNGSVAEIAGGGSDIAINTLSSSSGTGGGSATFNGSAFRFTLSSPPSVSAQQLLVSINGVIQKPVAGTGQPSEGFSVDGTDIILGDAPATGSDFFILTFKSLGVSEPADNSVTSAKIADGAIVNADINASAAIAGSKISPDFGSQNISTSGSAALGNMTIDDSIIHAGDTDTKIRFPADNKVSIETGGSERFRITPTGRIEQSNNNEDIDMDGFANGQLRLDGNGYNAALALNTDGLNIYCNSANRGIIFGTNETERVRITNIGRVGIGTTSPDSLLHLSGTEIVQAGAFSNNVTTGNKSFTASIDIQSTSMRGGVVVRNMNDFRSESVFNASFMHYDPFDTTATSFAFRAARGATLADTFSVRSDGRTFVGERLGIGTTSPVRNLHIKDTSPRIMLSNDNTGHASGDGTELMLDTGGNFEILQRENLNLEFFTNNLQRMTILGNGNVGIGDTNPDSLLHIGTGTNTDDGAVTITIGGTSVNARQSSIIKNNVGGNDRALEFHATTASNNHEIIKFFSDGITERMRIDSNGAVHIKSAGTSYTDFTGSSDAGLIIGSSSNSNSGVMIRTGTSGTGRLNFGDNSGSSSERSRGFVHYTHSDDSMQIGTNSSERMRIDTSGNVGIGTTSPSSYNADGRNLVVGKNAANTGITIASNSATGLGKIFFARENPATGSNNRKGLIAYEHQNEAMTFHTGVDERMRIDSSGRVLIGGTSKVFNEFLSVQKGGDSTHVATFYFNNTQDQTAVIIKHDRAGNQGDGTSATMMAFLDQTNGTSGSISSNGNSTSFNTSSDYRLKENEIAISDGITRLKTLKPYRFNFKKDSTKIVDGFFAHEVQNVIPEAISGEKDQVNEDGSIKPQQIDQSKLVPLLVAALQEAIGRIEALEAK